jgi:hypothetical protein
LIFPKGCCSGYWIHDKPQKIVCKKIEDVIGADKVKKIKGYRKSEKFLNSKKVSRFINDVKRVLAVRIAKKSRIS